MRGFPADKRKVREGRVPYADDKLHPGPVGGGEVYKQSRLKGRILANSVGRREPAVYGVYGARKGPVPMESCHSNCTEPRQRFNGHWTK